MTGRTDTAIIAKRVDSGRPDTEEIRELAKAAGYSIDGEITQTRTEDPAYCLGEGKVDELAKLTATSDASTVIFDNRLGPYQTYNLGTRLPEGITVIDRFRLILEIFGQRAQTRTAQLQVELAELRYELPRTAAKVSLARRDEHPGFMGLGEYDESREQDIKAQISRISDELEQIERTEQSRRDKRRESGFDLVAFAGYTNAGKSTLLRQLAAELSVDENKDKHPDLERTAESEDRLFTTLGTTTRRADFDRRKVLLTDTVGFISNLPHWLVESFKSTLSEVYRADLVLLVVDVSDPIDEIHEKLVTCHDTLYERNEAPIVTVLNKIDQVAPEELRRKQEALSALAPNPVSISAKTGEGIDDLRDRIHAELPDLQRERLVLPMTEETMSVVSWIHENTFVHEVEYGTGAGTVIEFEAPPVLIEQARAQARTLVTPEP